MRERKNNRARKVAERSTKVGDELQPFSLTRNSTRETVIGVSLGGETQVRELPATYYTF